MYELVEVVWCQQGGDGYLVGAEFLWVSWGDSCTKHAIEGYIATVADTDEDSG